MNFIINFGCSFPMDHSPHFQICSISTNSDEQNFVFSNRLKIFISLFFRRQSVKLSIFNFDKFLLSKHPDNDDDPEMIECQWENTLEILPFSSRYSIRMVFPSFVWWPSFGETKTYFNTIDQWSIGIVSHFVDVPLDDANRVLLLQTLKKIPRGKDFYKRKKISLVRIRTDLSLLWNLSSRITMEITMKFLRFFLFFWLRNCWIGQKQDSSSECSCSSDIIYLIAIPLHRRRYLSRMDLLLLWKISSRLLWSREMRRKCCCSRQSPANDLLLLH